jgi:uncharacterized protein with NRDE domain
MCIVLISTAHPAYPLVLINNRDEFLHRPTLPAAFWDAPNGHILSGRDLERAERGTWLGVTKQGRLAVLTNFREDDEVAAAAGKRSRGGMVLAFLQGEKDGINQGSTEEFVQRLLEPKEGDGEDNIKGVGGFSLICGVLRPISHGQGSENPNTDAFIAFGSDEYDEEPSSGAYPDAEIETVAKEEKKIVIAPLAVLSNRTESAESAQWIGGHASSDTHKVPTKDSKADPHSVFGLSNSAYDEPWPKVLLGKQLLADAIHKDILAHPSGPPTPASTDAFLDSLFTVLSHDTLPRLRSGHEVQSFHDGLRETIFVPAFGKPTADSGPHRENIRADAIAGTDTPDKRVEVLEGDAAHGAYGTQKQTVVLVDRNGWLTYVERTLWGCDGRRVEKGEGERRFGFGIEGWEGCNI